MVVFLLHFFNQYQGISELLNHFLFLFIDEGWHEEAISAAKISIELDNQDSDVLGFAGCRFADMDESQCGIGMIPTATSHI